ncbi:type-F conjugative transfer system pilin assembly protein TrbC [Novosphingobium sp. HII-3]|uniref:type-F conjugative transfer system pilin assembly protein TrbC n=1 Tax=Novosphingobium sp. HII-3 TaxID=2075565 RepID=UPI000CDB37D9|nr:type-F conjugative transfer system pilin assembly protein TrbC [Novosphingobium sp. HII-3]
MRKSILTVAGVLAAGLVSAALAQSIEGLDLQAIEKRGEAAEAEAQALLDFVKGQGQPQAEAAKGVVDEAYERIADLDVSGIAGGKDGPIDLDAMVAGAKGNLAGPKSTPLVIAFVSLSMPEEALRRTILDTTRAGGVIVFRGFSQGGAKPFVQMLAKAVEQKDAPNITIDPRLFRAFQVDRVPTIVAASSSFEPCDQLDCVTPPPPHDRISGNVTLSYALQTFADGEGPGAPASRVALANLVKRP